MNRAVEELEDMLTAEATRRGLEFTVEKDVENRTLMGDVIRLQQVLTNLVSNAFKFTPAGGSIIMRVTRTKSTNQQVIYKFQVIDNGVGISVENQKRVFGAFEQVGPNYSKSQGAGQGKRILFFSCIFPGGFECGRRNKDKTGETEGWRGGKQLPGAHKYPAG